MSLHCKQKKEKYLRSALFWDFTYRRFGTNYWSNLGLRYSWRWDRQVVQKRL